MRSSVLQVTKVVLTFYLLFYFLRGRQAAGRLLREWLPLTHYIRIVRSIMLKGATLSDLQFDTLALFGLMLIAMAIAVTRFRRTLD